MSEPLLIGVDNKSFQMGKLKINIESMRFSPSRPDIEWSWTRRLLGLSELAESATLIRDFDLELDEGRLAAIVGASGAGKTTLLRIIAGLETGYSGRVSLGETIIQKPDSRIYLAPQAHTLLPWYTVERNMQFNGGEDQLVTELLSMFGMSEKRSVYPRKLSGGERARVSLMCAMCARPQVLLLDEPFRGLDQLTKQQCMVDLLKWLKETGQNEIVIIVSHDISDAVYFCDEMIIVGSNPLHVHDRFTCSGGKDLSSQELIDLERKAIRALQESGTSELRVERRL